MVEILAALAVLAKLDGGGTVVCVEIFADAVQLANLMPRLLSFAFEGRGAWPAVPKITAVPHDVRLGIYRPGRGATFCSAGKLLLRVSKKLLNRSWRTT
jgi:hypothetical protein